MFDSTLAEEQFRDAIFHHYLEYARRRNPDTLLESAVSIALERQSQGKVQREGYSTESIFKRHPITHAPSPELIQIVIGFLEVEALIPDYSSVITKIVRPYAASVFFTQGWTGEEKVHSDLLGEWLFQSGTWTTRQWRLHLESTLNNSWDAVFFNENFANIFYGPISYVTIQEKRTAKAYKKLKERAQYEKQLGLVEICRLLERDEMRHHAFYLGMSRIALRYAPTTFPAYFAAAYEGFHMPGKYVRRPDGEQGIPHYDDWTNTAQQLGVVPDPKWAINIGRILRLGRETDLHDHNFRARLDCWNDMIISDREIFQQLGIPLAKTLQRLPLFETSKLPHQLTLSA